MTQTKPTHFHHVGLSVPDLDKALDFYTGLMGFTKTYRSNWSGSPEIDMALGADGTAGDFAMIELNGFCIELFQFETPEATTPVEPRVVGHGWTHICVKVPDARAVVAKLINEGVKIHADPIDIGDGPFSYIRDPFGNIIEVWQDET